MVLLVSGLISKLNHASIRLSVLFACVLACIHLSSFNCLSDLSVRYIFILWIRFRETRFNCCVFVDISCYSVPTEIIYVRRVERGPLRSACGEFGEAFV